MKDISGRIVINSTICLLTAIEKREDVVPWSQRHEAFEKRARFCNIDKITIQKDLQMRSIEALMSTSNEK